MSKHTKGPWELKNGWIWDKDSMAIAKTCSRNLNDEEYEANARLIASAPELLEACKYLTEWLHTSATLIKNIPEHLQLYPLIEKAQQAIAKAEGK